MKHLFGILVVSNKLCANLRKAAVLRGSRHGTGLGEDPWKSSLGEFPQYSSYPNPGHSEHAPGAQGPIQNKWPQTLDSAQSILSCSEGGSSELFLPTSHSAQLCILTTNACYIPLGAPARRKGKRVMCLLNSYLLQGYFSSPLVSGQHPHS